MAIIKCKMCGGDIELTADKTFGTCEFCGSTMTLPKIDDDQRAAAFNRGNHFRRIGEFDKALSVYERIVREDDTDAEAHWCCALCRFGIEYVEDPATYEYLPTCHRASFDSFLEDVDYLAAVEHSDGITKRQYQKDAAKIAEVQRGILATSQNAEPYDVFICYKESDADGNRTRDSLMAQDIYYQLTEQGRKVFFARITLEDVAGTQYEPYIFAALNSAKVMIVVGTKPEHLNAVWVKNEWSRFLAMMKKDRHKLLLPCYRDMDPYDMPEALSVLQSYDMSKIGFIQDLTRGIAKVLDAEKKSEPVKETVVVQQTGSANIAPLLKRAFMFLEDSDWNSADEYCEKVLDIDPECAQAYLGKLMAELHVKSQEALKDQAEPFDGKKHYQKAIRFGDEKLKSALAGYIEHITIRNENARLEDIYSKAKSEMLAAYSENAYIAAANLFASISDYKDAALLEQGCCENAETARKNSILSSAKYTMQTGTIVSYHTAIGLLESIPGWKNVDEQIAICERKIAELEAAAEQERLVQEERERKEMLEREERAHQQAEADRLAREERARQKAEAERLAREKAEADRIEAERVAKKKKKISIIVACIACMILVIVLVLTKVIIPNNKYNDAVALMKSGEYAQAQAMFIELGSFKDSVDKQKECHFAELDIQYNKAIALKEAGEYETALSVFQKIGTHKDSAEQIAKCTNAISKKETSEKLKKTNIGDRISFGMYEQDANLENGKEEIQWIVLDKKDDRILVISQYCLDCQPFNTSYAAVTWETCTLRQWLNNDFLQTAFSDNEQAMISTATVTTEKHPKYNTDPGNITVDKVFLLSRDESMMYFSSESKRQSEPTKYTYLNGASTGTDNEGYCWWWLRTPANIQESALCVNFAGYPCDYDEKYDIGGRVDQDYITIRPAMWIDLNA